MAQASSMLSQASGLSAFARANTDGWLVDVVVFFRGGLAFEREHALEQVDDDDPSRERMFDLS
jgi:hypothetical protein